eukprot:4185673-Prymnesium_polylepis.3
MSVCGRARESLSTARETTALRLRTQGTAQRHRPQTTHFNPVSVPALRGEGPNTAQFYGVWKPWYV